MSRDLLRAARVVAVARNTFREVLRNRAFVGLLVFAVAFLLGSLLMSELTVVGQGHRVVLDFGFFAVSLFGAVTAVVMGALLVHKEIERKTVYTILTKPIHRYEFILGKYLGILALLAAEVSVLAGVWALVVLSQGGDVGLEHAKGMLLVGFEVSLVAAVAVMFSATSTPLLTGLFSLGVFLVGRVVYLVAEMLQGTHGLFAENPVANVFGRAVVAVFPDLSVFNVSQEVLLGVPVSLGYLVQSLLYAACYAAIFLVVAVFAFERRDFT